MSRKKSSSNKKRRDHAKNATQLTPEYHKCPITKEKFTDPVICEDGFTYEREAITTWLQTNNISPITRGRIGKQIIPNKQLCQQLDIDLSSAITVKEKVKQTSPATTSFSGNEAGGIGIGATLFIPMEQLAGTTGIIRSSSLNIITCPTSTIQNFTVIAPLNSFY